MRVDVERVLRRLGIEVTSTVGEHLNALCPYHQDSNPSWRIRRRGDKAGLHHCFGAETLVLTKKGPVPIAKLAGTSPTLLTMRNGRGVWVKAPIHSFGRQPLWEVILSRNGVKKVIQTTALHRWYVRTSLTSWTEKTTDQLRKGHRLRAVTPPKSGVITVSPWGVAHGFVYGDGTLTKYGARVTLWGEKDRALEKFFPLSPKRSVETPGGVEGIEIGHLPRKFRELPTMREAPAYLYGWLAGYFAADGCVSEGGVPSITSADRGALEFVERLCLRLGLVTYGVREYSRFGFGSAPSTMFVLAFSRASFSEDFFLVAKHKERWLKGRSAYDRLGWAVESVRPIHIVEEVFCATVPETHCFALDGFILTGNCKSCDAGGDLADLVMQVRGLHNKSVAKEWLEQFAEVVDRQDLEQARVVVRAGARRAAAFRYPLGVVDEPSSEWPTPVAEYVFSPPPKGRGITVTQARLWGIAYALEGRLAGRIVIPVWDRQKRLASYMARTFTGQKKRYLTPDEKEGADLDAVFGEFFWGPDRSPNGDTVVVTEGALKSLGVDRALPGTPTAGLGGSHVRPIVVAKLAGRFRRAIVLTDADKAGERAGDEIEAGLARHLETERARLAPGQDADSVPPAALRAKLLPLFR